MNEISPPVHSVKTLIISSLFSIVAAFLILLFFIAPAEYGIDPTGVGQRLGLMALAKKQPTKLPPQAQSCPTGETTKKWQDIVLITIPAKSSVEYKFIMQPQVELEYEWQSNAGEIYFDFHGEPAGDSTGYFKSYQINKLASVAEKFIIPFAGIHGWYWNNKSDHSIQITLKTKGEYKIKGLIEYN